MRIKSLNVAAIFLLILSTCTSTRLDDDFAEFEDEEFEVDRVDQDAASEPELSENPAESVKSPETTKEDVVPDMFDDEEDGTVEVEDGFNEFDAEEFEAGEAEESMTQGKPMQQEELKFAKVPINFRRNWTSYYVELSLVFGMLLYFLAFLLGRSKNSTLAHAWFKANKDLLKANFAIVGDDGSSAEPSNNVLMKESDHSYVMWCSGRIGVEGMLVQLKMVKRQDLINVLQRIVKPVSDQLIYQVKMENSDMDPFIFCFAQKKSASKLHKDMTDLALFIETKKKGEDYGLPSSYQVLSEMSEATKTFTQDPKVQAFISKYEGVLEYVHMSDKYSGERPADDGDSKKMPETSKCLTFCFNAGKKGRLTSKDMVDTEEWSKLVLHCVEKCRRYRLSRECKAKSDKNRQRVQESYDKLAHQQRIEQAQLRTEEKRKAETERYMNEEDPVKARKLEEKRQKRDQAKKMQKMKSVKIKSS